MDDVVIDTKRMRFYRPPTRRRCPVPATAIVLPDNLQVASWCVRGRIMGWSRQADQGRIERRGRGRLGGSRDSILDGQNCLSELSQKVG